MATIADYKNKVAAMGNAAGGGESGWGPFLAGLSGLPIIGPLFGNMLNYQNQQENLEYMRWAQQISWDREDNAVQRRVADLRAAGLSPTLAAGSAAQTMSPVRTEPSRMESNNLGPMLLGLLSGIMDISKSQEEIKLSRLQQDKLRIENLYREELNPLKIDEQKIKNEFSSATVQDRIKTVAAKKTLAELQDDNLSADTALKTSQTAKAYSDAALNVVRGVMYGQFAAEASARRETFDRNRLTEEQQKQMIAAEIAVKKAIATYNATQAGKVAQDIRSFDEFDWRDIIGLF